MQELPACSNKSTTTRGALPEADRHIFDLKYSAPAFSAMTLLALLKGVRIMFYKVHVVTGWHIPDDPNHMQVLEDQFCKKLLEDYRTLNFQEIEFAFRHYGGDIQEWGKSFNLSLFSQVVACYQARRNQVSLLEDRAEPLLLEEKKDLSPQEWIEWIEETKKEFLYGGRPVNMLPSVLYDYLDKIGTIHLDDVTKRKYFKAAAAAQIAAQGFWQINMAQVAAKQTALSKFFKPENETGNLDPGTIPAASGCDESE